MCKAAVPDARRDERDPGAAIRLLGNDNFPAGANSKRRPT